MFSLVHLILFSLLFYGGQSGGWVTLKVKEMFLFIFVFMFLLFLPLCRILLLDIITKLLLGYVAIWKQIFLYLPVCLFIVKGIIKEILLIEKHCGEDSRHKILWDTNRLRAITKNNINIKGLIEKLSLNEASFRNFLERFIEKVWSRCLW